MVGLRAKRSATTFLRERFGFSERRACRLVKLWRSSKRYKSVRPAEKDLRDRLRTHAERWRRFGYRRLHVMLKREGIHVNHKKIFRLYKEEGLDLKRKRSKKLRSLARVPMTTPTKPNERWSMDFVSDQLEQRGEESDASTSSTIFRASA